MKTKILLALLMFTSICFADDKKPMAPSLQEIVSVVKQTSVETEELLADAGKSTSTYIGKVIDSTKVDAINTYNKVDTSSLFATIYSDFKSGIVAIAKAMKVEVDKLIHILVKQQIVLGIIGLIQLIFIGGIILYCLRKVLALPNLGEFEIPNFSFILLKIGTILMSLIVIYCVLLDLMSITLQRLLNPEYQVFMQIVDIVKQLK